VFHVEHYVRADLYVQSATHDAANGNGTKELRPALESRRVGSASLFSANLQAVQDAFEGRSGSGTRIGFRV